MTYKALTITAVSIISLLLVSCGTDQTESRVQAKASAQPTTETAPAPTPAATIATAAAGAPGVASAVALDLNGHRQPLSKWIGQQPVVINFWGTWCPPCRREIPELIRLYAEFKPRGVEIISLAVRDTPTKVKYYAEKAGMEWVQMMGTQKLVVDFSLTGSVPTTIFLDRNGNEVTRFIGARSYDAFRPAFEAIVAN